MATDMLMHHKVPSVLIPGCVHVHNFLITSVEVNSDRDYIWTSFISLHQTFCAAF